MKHTQRLKILASGTESTRANIYRRMICIDLVKHSQITDTSSCAEMFYKNSLCCKIHKNH